MLTFLLFAEPCPPRDVMVNHSCEDHSALVSWTTSPVAQTYHVVAKGVDGHVHTCNTTSSNCSLSELHCDQQYTVFVTASHENCSSKASQNAALNTGICPLCTLYAQYTNALMFKRHTMAKKNIRFSILRRGYEEFSIFLLSRSLPARWSLSYVPL